MPAYCCGQLGSAAIDGAVRSSRRLDVGDTWIDTGLKRLISWQSINCDGNPFYNVAVGNKRIVAAATDVITQYKDTVADEDCTADEDNIFVLSLLSGKIVNDDCWINANEGNELLINYECCEL